MVHLPLVSLTNLALPDMAEYVLLEALLREPLPDGLVDLGEPLVA